jgi:hypothetical protein
MPKQPAIAEEMTDQDYRDLTRAQYILNNMLPKLDRAREAGRDVTDVQLARDDLAAQVEALKKAYFPNRQ